MASSWIDKLGDFLFALRDKLHRARGGRGSVNLDQLKDQVTDALTPKMPDASDQPDQLQARRVINKNPVLVGLACAALVAVFVAIGWYLTQPSRLARPADVWYYDMGTSQLTVAPGGALPELLSGNGPVVAHKYACGQCDSHEQFIGYLEALSVDPAHRQAAYEASQASDDEVKLDSVPEQTRVVANPNLEGGWVPADSVEGHAIIDAAASRCPNNTAQLCLP
jgi:hypothetical protein